MARPTKEEIEQMADRAEARSAGTLYDDEWERSFGEKVDQAKRELDRDSGVYQAEIERLALLPPDLDYQFERKSAAKRLGIPVTSLDRMVRARRPKKAAKESAPVFDLDKLADSASHIIHCADILELFAKDFAKVIAGEDVIGKLLYLVATSRLFDKPMNAAIKGTSAGGKSEIRKRILAFFPPEDVVGFTSLSERALIYFDGDFSHKVLSMGEATATDEQTFQDYLLRELMSEGHIRHSTAQKIGNDIQTVQIEKDGPVAFLVTTTKNKMNPENETRMLSLEIDDTQEQTKKVLKKIARVAGLQNAPLIDYDSWQDFQRWLGTGERRVVVPFADALADLMEALAVRLRRDFGQVLAAVQAHALLHREQRDRDESGRIVADINRDYGVVRELMSAIVAEGTGADIKKEVVETINAVGKATIGMDENEGATAKDIAKLLKLDKSAAWRRLSAASDDGYVVNLEQRKGMPGKYRATGQKVEPVVILPLTADLISSFTSPPSKIDEPCNREQITETSQADTGCKPHLQPDSTGQPEAPDRMHGCNRLQDGLATDNSLNSNGESPPVARLHGFLGGTDEEEKCESGVAIEPSPDDDLPLVCEHCGEPATPTSPVQLYSVDGKECRLHPACQADWLGDLSILPSLDRRHEICAHCGEPGGTEWDYDGVKVRLHERCEEPWLDARLRGRTDGSSV